MRSRPLLVEQGRFLGDPIRSRNVCGVSMVDASYRAGLVLPVHTHQSAYLCWIRSGQYAEAYETRKGECLASTAYSTLLVNATPSAWGGPMFSLSMWSSAPNG